jgi:DNA-binding HxlR family transcriptional regulator
MARRTYARFCPLSMALEDVGDRWALHIVYALLDGPKRYADLKLFLNGAGSNVLGDRLRQLADAQIVGRRTGDRPGTQTMYYLTERGLGLAPVVQALVRWGMASLTMTGSTSSTAPTREVFDQTWTMPDAAQIVNETYQWTVDGVDSVLAVTGSTLTRTRGRVPTPAATLTTSSDVLDAVLAGHRTLSEATASGDVELSGPADAIERMFTATGFPDRLLGFDGR